jgi:hypothetical protein
MAQVLHFAHMVDGVPSTLPVAVTKMSARGAASSIVVTS